MTTNEITRIWTRIAALAAATLVAAGFMVHKADAAGSTLQAAPQQTAFIMGRTDGGSKTLQSGSPYDRTVVRVKSPHPAGTIIIDTSRRFLYLVKSDGTAVRYGVGVGRPGFEWTGTHAITRKEEWPDWRPPEEMRARQPYLPVMMPGGPRNPLGARALYIGSTLYRIHGTNEATTIGQAVSSGCIRMLNEDIIDLYQQVDVGTKVVVF